MCPCRSGLREMRMPAGQPTVSPTECTNLGSLGASAYGYTQAATCPCESPRLPLARQHPRNSTCTLFVLPGQCAACGSPLIASSSLNFLCINRQSAFVCADLWNTYHDISGASNIRPKGCVRLPRSVELLYGATVKPRSAADLPNHRTGRRVLSRAASRAGHAGPHGLDPRRRLQHGPARNALLAYLRSPGGLGPRIEP